MEKSGEIIEKVVDAYFNEPNKTLKDIFEEYTVNLSAKEKETFYNNLKVIIS